MCSKCYREWNARQAKEAADAAALSPLLAQPPAPLPEPTREPSPAATAAAPAIASVVEPPAAKVRRVLPLPLDMTPVLSRLPPHCCQAAAAENLPTTSEPPAAPESEGKKRSNRCAVCSKKVGLTGFTCKCNAGLFCSSHRW